MAGQHPHQLVPLESLERILQDILHPPPPFPPYLYPPMPVPALPLSPPHDSRSLSPATSTAAGASPASDAAASLEPSQPCQWDTCDKSFPDAEVLYNHLCNDHIGRKSTNNLCLTCRWKDCQTSCAKRDHITSHLRGQSSHADCQHPPLIAVPRSVHTPLKPHICEVSTAGAITPPHQSINSPSLSDLQKVFQTPSGSEEARKDPYRGAPCPTQALQGDHRR